MQVLDNVPVEPGQFVAVWQINNFVYSDTFQIRKVESDQTDHFCLEIFEEGAWVLRCGYQNNSGCKHPSLGYWPPGTKFLIPS